MSAEQKQGQWLRDGAMVYTLDDCGANYWMAQVQPAGGNSAPLEERKKVAQIMQAAPDLLKQLRNLLTYADGIHRVQAYMDEHEVTYETFPEVRDAIEKATGERS